MTKIFLTSLTMLLVFVTAGNARDIWYSSDLSKWGIERAADCGGTGAEAGFTGDKVGTNSEWSEYLVNNWTYAGGTNGRDGFNAIYYLASARYPHGYKFCKTVVAADRWGDMTWPDVVFYKPSTEDCFTLCESGYYGPICGRTTPVLETGNVAQFKAAQSFSTGAVHKLANNSRSTKIADVVVIGRRSRGCSGNKQIDLKGSLPQEHEVVLALKKVVTETNAMTFTIQPMIVRAGAQPGFWLAPAKGYKYAWPMVKFQGTEKSNYCPSAGFIYENGKCVVDEHAQNYQKLKAEKEAAREQERKNKQLICPELESDLNFYSNKEHVFKESTFGEAMCMEFVCEGEDLGFWGTHPLYDNTNTARNKYSCVSCDVAAPEGENAAMYDALYGVSSDQKTCLSCKIGEYYNKDDKKCVPSKTLHMRDMAYGPGKNNRDELKLQCWTMGNPDCYKLCVEGADSTVLEEKGCVQGGIQNVDQTLQGLMDEESKSYTDRYNGATYDSYSNTVTITDKSAKQESPTMINLSNVPVVQKQIALPQAQKL
ncbi:MAG: hypothetical protein R8M71_01590 [Alphaproteobacteria bacterium]|nr:hypothetical protein [Alphaproteobacteria bacterium]